MIAGNSTNNYGLLPSIVNKAQSEVMKKVYKTK